MTATAREYEFFKTSRNVFRVDPSFPLRAFSIAQDPTTPHRHEFTEVVFVTAGSGVHLSANGAACGIGRGDILVIPPGIVHGYDAVEGLRLTNLLFDAARLPLALLDLYMLPSFKYLFIHRFAPEDPIPHIHVTEERFAELETFFGKLTELDGLAKPRPGDHAFKLGIFMALLSRTCDCWNESGMRRGTGREAPDIHRVLGYMNRNFRREIFLADLARAGGMSPRSLARHFRAAVGTSPMEYVGKLRLHHAAQLLADTELTPKEVAARSGYARTECFFRAFKKEFGATPLAYRRNHEASSPAAKRKSSGNGLQKIR